MKPIVFVAGDAGTMEKTLLSVALARGLVTPVADQEFKQNMRVNTFGTLGVMTLACDARAYMVLSLLSPCDMSDAFAQCGLAESVTKYLIFHSQKIIFYFRFHH